jgi:hypothetical protein
VKEEAKPTYEDARLLVEMVKLTQDEKFAKARSWYFANLPEDPPMKLEEFENKFPEGSEGNEAFSLVSSHFETAGVLVKHGVLNEDLYFDRYFVEPYWDRAKVIVREQRGKWHPAIAENFEWLARRAGTWRRKQAAQKKR